MSDLTARYCLLHFKMAALDFLTTKSGSGFLSWSFFLICHQEKLGFHCLFSFIYLPILEFNVCSGKKSIFIVCHKKLRVNTSSHRVCTAPCTDSRRRRQRPLSSHCTYEETNSESPGMLEEKEKNSIISWTCKLTLSTLNLPPTHNCTQCPL